ncbi:MAG TPA: lytic transglycosylase domain-containing protein [Bryobacteraceae bacterium]|nr:lytic transglycosylase domain-containing protein [Bryobacteraceae bacterium]
MRVCFKALLSVGALGALGTGNLCFGEAAGSGAPESAIVYRSVVRTNGDGHLIRRVMVTPKAVVPKTVSPVEVHFDETKPNPISPSIPTLPTEIQDLIEQTAAKHEVDPLLVHSVIEVESAFNPNALSPKGAQGLMQLIPATARRFGASNAFDVKQNVEAGVKYLKYLSDLFPNDLRLTLAAYNAGEGAVWKYNNNVPPYRETEQYVYKVGQKYGKARKAAGKVQARVEPKPSANEAQYRRVESYVDSEGRLFLRTAPETIATP